MEMAKKLETCLILSESGGRRNGLKLRNMYKKVKSSIFFKLFIKFVTFKTCVFLPAVRINLQVKKRTKLK